MQWVRGSQAVDKNTQVYEGEPEVVLYQTPPFTPNFKVS